MSEREKKDTQHNETASTPPEEPTATKTVDTLQQDEALKVLARYAGEETWTAGEEKKLVRKIDRKLITLLCITYGLQYYDKAMLSQAALFGLRTDLNLSAIVTPFPPAYSILDLSLVHIRQWLWLNAGRKDIPSQRACWYRSAKWNLGCASRNLLRAPPSSTHLRTSTDLLPQYRIERVAAAIVCVWGVCLMCSAACHNWQGFYAQRFFLGFLESGISPMFMLVVGGWYTKPEQALRMGAWYSCTGYVSAVSPLINYGLGHIKGGNLNSWQYMYLVAGAITVLWAIIILFFMPPDPIRARGFDDRERYIAVARMRANNSGVRNTHFKAWQVYEALLDLKFWLVFATAFLMMIANGPVSSFIPIIISGFGYNSLNSLLLTLPAGVVIGCFELGAPYLAYRVPRIRTWIIALCQVGTIIASILLWRLPRSEKGGLLFACYILASFGGGCAVLMGLQIANTAGYTKRSVTSSGIFIGYCLGNFVGPLLFKLADAPAYAPGFIAVLITSIVAALLAVVYRYVCIWENQRRDKTGTLEGFEHAYEHDLTDKRNPQFRYTL